MCDAWFSSKSMPEKCTCRLRFTSSYCGSGKHSDDLHALHVVSLATWTPSVVTSQNCHCPVEPAFAVFSWSAHLCLLLLHPLWSQARQPQQRHMLYPHWNKQQRTHSNYYICLLTYCVINSALTHHPWGPNPQILTRALGARKKTMK